MNQQNIFEKCILLKKTQQANEVIESNDVVENEVIESNDVVENEVIEPNDVVENEVIESNDVIEINDENVEELNNINVVDESKSDNDFSNIIIDENEIVDTNNTENTNNTEILDMPDTINEPIEINVEEILGSNESQEPEECDIPLENFDNNVISLKKKNDVYYEKYRIALSKAKMAKELALASFLEAKNIKNTYMLEDIDDSDLDDSISLESD